MNTRWDKKTAFANVVGHEQNRLFRFLLNANKLLAHALGGDGVETAEGLVHDENRRVDRECTGHGNALLHASRDLVRKIVLVTVESHELEVSLDAGTPVRLGQFRLLER